MKIKGILLIIIQLFVLNILTAQSLSESLGGTKTNFLIYSEDALFIYSLDLIDIPVVILDKTKKIDIIKLGK